jgi:hypothetical protein
LAGFLRWTDYRSKEWPSAIKIEHHKTGAVVWHPLEELTDAGIVKFYEDAEAVLARLPRRGVPMILREVREGITNRGRRRQQSRMRSPMRPAGGCATYRSRGRK